MNTPLVKLSSGYIVRCDSDMWLPHAIQAGHMRERDVCVSILRKLIDKVIEIKGVEWVNENIRKARM